MASGVVKFFKHDKGYGFITPDDGAPDVFVHIKDLRATQITSLDAEDEVSFETVKSDKGHRAVNIKKLSSVSATSR